MPAIDQIRQGGTVYEIVPEIAELFSTTKSYSAGDSVIYEAGLYTFKESKTAGAWDATKVDGPSTITEKLAQTNGRLHQLGGNVFDADTYTVLDNMYLSPTGAFAEGTAIPRLIRVEAKPNKIYCIQKTTSTAMRAGAYSDAPVVGARTESFAMHESASDAPLYVRTTEANHYIYIHLFSNSDTQDMQSIEANIKSLCVCESLVDEIDDIKYRYTVIDAPATVPGGKNTVFRIEEGETYVIVNGTTGAITARTLDKSGTVAQVVTEGLKVGERIFFTADQSADQLRVYFAGSGNVYVQHINSPVNGVIEAVKPNINWTIGGISFADGKSVNATNRVRSGFIPCGEYGTTVTLPYGYLFNVFEYLAADEETNLIVRDSSTDWLQAKTYRTTNSRCRYIRIVIKKLDNSDFTDTSVSSVVTVRAFVPTAVNNEKIITDDYDTTVYTNAELPQYSTTDKLSTLYSMWDALTAEYPDNISREVLGTISGKEMRCYTIKPTPLNLPVTGTGSYKYVKTIKILYVTAIHGNEECIAVDDYKFFENLVKNHEPAMLWNNCIIKVIPTANPVGYDANTRNNGNGVNLNRNFPVGWRRATDEYNASGSAPASEIETQLLMKFVLDNSDALLTINSHNTDGWSIGQRAGYAASRFQSDLDVAYSAFCSLDTEMRKSYPAIDTFQPEANSFSLKYSTEFPGSFDQWFTSVGMHGYLIELCVSGGTYSISVDDCRRIRYSAIMALIKSCVKNNRIFDKHEQLI